MDPATIEPPAPATLSQDPRRPLETVSRLTYEDSATPAKLGRTKTGKQEGAAFSKRCFSKPCRGAEAPDRKPRDSPSKDSLEILSNPEVLDLYPLDCPKGATS